MKPSNFDSDERLRFEITIGLETPTDLFSEFISDLKRNLSALSGGLRVVYGNGVWRSDGNSEAPFTGDLSREVCATFVITLDPNNPLISDLDVVDGARSSIMHRFKYVWNYLGYHEKNLDIQWIDVQHTVVRTAHFDITASEWREALDG